MIDLDSCHLGGISVLAMLGTRWTSLGHTGRAKAADSDGSGSYQLPEKG